MAAVHAPVVLLPGILVPARARFAALMAALDGREPWPEELEVRAGDAPPAGYTVDDEVAGLSAFLDERGVGRVHLYGHSAGASIALAFTAEHGDRVLSLALDELATDFSAEDQDLIAALWPGSLDDLPVPQRMQVFARGLVAPRSNCHRHRRAHRPPAWPTAPQGWPLSRTRSLAGRWTKQSWPPFAVPSTSATAA